MATVKTTYLGNLRTEAEHLQSGAKIITDAPVDNHGKGEAFSPTDLMAASYASCALTIIGIAAQTHGFDVKGAEVETTKVMGESPRRIAELVVHFTFPHNNYSEKERKIIEGAIAACPVANTLPPETKISRTIRFKN
jgi:Predicted redox protein, regulator of disulfide bond formation